LSITSTKVNAMTPHPLARRFGLFSCLGLVLGSLLAVPARSQEVLPFPPTPSASTAGLTMQDGAYRKRVEPKRLADVARTSSSSGGTT